MVAPTSESRHGRNDSAVSALSMTKSDFSQDLDQKLDPETTHDDREPASTIEWTDKEDRQVLKKIDRRLLAAFLGIYMIMQMDRANVSNALTDNLLEDMHLTSGDYNNAMTITRVAFFISEFPVQCMIMRYGFRNVFPYLVMIWGMASAVQAFVTSRSGFYGLRAVIGFCEGGFVPGVVYFFTQFYTRAELAPRLAWLTAVSDLAGALASFIAAGVLTMRGTLHRPGWFWLFIIEGLLTFCTGLFAALYLPRSARRTTSVLCRKPWFSPRELAILEGRLIKDDPSKRRHQDGKRVPTSFRTILSTWRDPHLWGLMFLSTVAIIFTLPMKMYLHLTLRRLGFSVMHSNLLAVPSAFLQLITVLIISFSSEHFKERTWHCVGAILWVVPCFIGLLCVRVDNGVGVNSGSWARYTLSTLICGAPSMYPLILSWVSELSCTVETRAINVASSTSLALIGAVVTTQMYSQRDEPYYDNGNKAELGLAAFTIAGLVAHKYYYQRINRKRDSLARDGDGENGGQQVNVKSEADAANECQTSGRRDHEVRNGPEYRFPS